MSLTRSGEPVTLVVPDRLEEAVAGSGLVRAAAAALLGTRIEQLRVRLSMTAGRFVAQANAVTADRRVRVQVAAGDHDGAIRALMDRLYGRVLEAAACWSPRPWPDPDGVSAPTADPEPFDAAPAGQRAERITRIKPVSLVWCPATVAVATMDLMDYGAHLFTDTETEQETVVYRAGPVGYRLARLRPAAPPRQQAVPLTVDPRPAPVLTREQAVARLDATGLAHLFFADARTGRGQLLYRRFDGHYALITEGP